MRGFTMKRTIGNLSLFNSLSKNNSTNPLLNDQDSLDEKHTSDQKEEDLELTPYYSLTHQIDEKQECKIKSPELQEKMDEKYSRMDRRLHKIQDRLFSRWFLLLPRLQAPENQSFRKFLCKQLSICGALSVVALGGLLVITKGMALVHDRIAAYDAAFKAFYVDINPLLHYNGVYGATCNETTSVVVYHPYLCDYAVPSTNPLYSGSYNKIMKAICEPAARILCSHTDDGSKGWNITGIIVFSLALIALTIFFVKFIRNPRSGLLPIHNTNILPILSSDHKEFLIESRVIMPTDTEITIERLSQQINQRRRQFMLFNTLGTQKLSQDNSLIVAQYDEEVSLSCIPIAGDFASGKESGSPEYPSP